MPHPPTGDATVVPQEVPQEVPGDLLGGTSPDSGPLGAPDVMRHPCLCFYAGLGPVLANELRFTL